MSGRRGDQRDVRKTGEGSLAAALADRAARAADKVRNAGGLAASKDVVGASKETITRSSTIPPSTNASQRIISDAERQNRTASQRKRRQEQRLLGDKWVGKRPSTHDRTYSLKDKITVVHCHRDWALGYRDIGSKPYPRIPMRDLVEKFNNKVKDGEPRSLKGLQSLITKNEQLQDMRSWYQ